MSETQDYARGEAEHFMSLPDSLRRCIWLLIGEAKGVRVDGDKVIVAVKGGNHAARWLCGELVSLVAADRMPPQNETPNDTKRLAAPEEL